MNRHGLLARTIALLAAAGINVSGQTVTNLDYQLTVLAGGSVEVRHGNIRQVLRPEFTVMFSATDPGYNSNSSNYLLAPREAARWSKYQQNITDLNLWLQEELGLDVTVTEDGSGARTWDYGSLQVTGTYALGTTNPFFAGGRTSLAPSQTVFGVNGEVIWQFTNQPAFDLSAQVTLPPPAGDPRIEYHLTARQSGYFSVIFTGFPGIPAAESVTVSQEAAGRSFKQFCHVIPECVEKLPRVHVYNGVTNLAAVVDPKETVFNETMPTRLGSRFGTMLWKENGVLTPMIVAPVMGSIESQMASGTNFNFTLRFVMRSGDWKETYQYIAREIFSFRDMRDNSGAGSLNQTIRRITDFLLNRNGGNYAQWHAEQKYYNYWSDKSGVFKPFSPLFGLAAAVVMDDEEFYRERALPIVEFSLSRMSNVFSPYDVHDTGMVSTEDRRLGSPYVSVGQLSTMWSLYKERNEIFRYCANQKGFSTSVADQLAARRFTGSASNLTAAVKAGDSLLSSGGGTYFDLLDIYEASGEPRFLEGAKERVYATAVNVNLFPPVPDTNVTFDRGGKVPIHAHSFGRNALWGYPAPQNFPAPEQTVPAWRGSEIGLESLGTYRAELWMNNPPQYLRIGAYAHDDFLRDIAHWAAVGRFGNYPGDNRSERSLVTEVPDAPEHPIWQQTYATFNPGHAWEFLGALIDFLVTDAFDRSAGGIAFPAGSLAGSQFRVNVYGDRPGQFYDESDVQLWIPRDLLQIDNKQIDWLAGYGNGKLYLAFWNQSFTNHQVQVDLNPERADASAGSLSKTWVQNQVTNNAGLSGNRLTFSVPAKGICAVAINNVNLQRQLQAKMFDPAAVSLGTQSHNHSAASFGTVHAMLLSMGRGLTSAFVYTDALPENVIKARLKYRQGTDIWREAEDTVFPFEFSVWIDEDKGAFDYSFEIENLSQAWSSSGTNALSF